VTKNEGKIKPISVPTGPAIATIVVEIPLSYSGNHVVETLPEMLMIKDCPIPPRT
jgi:hypothetical protein